MTAVPCPNPDCGDTVVGRYCESCRYDVETGEPPAPEPVAALLELGADRAHWDSMVGSGEPAFPADPPSLTFELPDDRDQVTLGRARARTSPDPDLALTGAAADPAVSHQQCIFERDGATWTVRDAASANGTWINGAAEPLETGTAHTLQDGDRICVGAWTCLTVRLRR